MPVHTLLPDSLRQRLLPFLLAGLGLPVGAQATTYAPWLTQIGITDTVMSAGKWGTGTLLGVVDSGIVPGNPAFTSGQVSTVLSGCAALTFRCSSGYVDDNGHGTAVASIAAANKLYMAASNYGGYVVQAGSVIGVAPNANIVAEKVLNVAGSGYSSDVANGIRKAADAGARVINVSITYGTSTDIVAAINYATTRGAFIVWAGGNSNIILGSGINTAGLSTAALSRIIFAGSVSPTNLKSSFSNTPGGARLIATNGSAATYASRWLMAPGEAILAPSVTAGSSAWSYWSGTSMAAPIVAGSLVLLETAWPILHTNGSAENLLLATATDLGSKGVDYTFGAGLLNLTAAFQPVGTLTVRKSNGQNIAVTGLTKLMITSGALGSLASVQARLADYTALDSYLRNFSVDLSGLIKTPSSVAKLNALPTNTNTGVKAIKFADGRYLEYWDEDDKEISTQGITQNQLQHLGEFGYNEDIRAPRRNTYAMLTDTHGNVTAFGFGAPTQYAFARALHGDEAMASLASESGVSNFGSIAQSGSMATYGTSLGEHTRLAIAWSSTTDTRMAVIGGNAPAWVAPDAYKAAVGLSHRLSDALAAGFTVGTLEENHGLLGSTYNADSALNLGRHARSMSYGTSLGYRINRNKSLLAEGSMVETRASNPGGLFAEVGRLRAYTWSLSYQHENLWARKDRLSLGVIQPLRVKSGQAGVIVTNIDEDGIAHYDTEHVGLAPDGHELDYKLSYNMPLDRASSLSVQAAYRKDANNIKDRTDASIITSWSRRF
jgi:hypothetical protein